MSVVNRVTILYEAWGYDGDDWETSLGRHPTQEDADRACLAFVIEQLGRWDRDILVERSRRGLDVILPVYDAAKRSPFEAMQKLVDMDALDSVIDMAECRVGVLPINIDIDHFNLVVRENERLLDDGTLIEIIAKRKAGE